MAEKKSKGSRVKKFAAWITGGVLFCLAAAYFISGLYYNKHFFPNVTINGRDVSGLTAGQVKEDIIGESRTYVLRIHTRDGGEEVLNGEDFGLQLQYGDASLSELLDGQQFWKWGLHLFTSEEHEVPVMAAYDEGALNEQIGRLSCIDPGNMTAPENAYLAYSADEGFRIVPEVRGSRIHIGDFKEQVIDAVNNAKTDISLEELGLYAEPEITQDNENLKADYLLWKPYMETKILYRFDDMTETLDAGTFYEWMSVDPKGKITFDREKIREYVKGIAKKYNTAYLPKVLETSYGETVTITTGPYGWLVNQPEETEALEAALLACESQEREPVYHQRAASHTGADYGDTYVEINLSAQHLFFYKDGELLVESDFVSGNEARGWATPAGAFPLTYKERNATLKGQGYATPVSYWMPFNGNIGLHDSSWRSSFGKNIYKTNGSHGCINLPPAVAEIIYDNIEKGMPVLCYYLSGTEYQSSEPDTGESTDNAPQDNPEFPDAVAPEDILFPDTAVPENEVPVNEVPVDEIPVNEAAPDNIGIPDTAVVPDSVSVPEAVQTDSMEQPPLNGLAP